MSPLHIAVGACRDNDRMSLETLVWAMKPKGLSPTEQLVLIHLANFANHRHQAWPSHKALAELTGYTQRTIYNALRNLTEGEFIQRKARYRKDGSRTSDLMTLTARELTPPADDQDPPHEDDIGGEPDATQNLPMNHPMGVTTNVVVSEADQVRAAFAEYNMVAASIGKPRAQKLTDERKRSIRARLRDCGGLSGWTVAMTKLQESPFLTGNTPEEFMITLDFVLQPRSFTRLMEGYYLGRQRRPQSFSEQRDASLAASRESAFAILRGEQS